jgi:PAS domain S-box-containing protein
VVESLGLTPLRDPLVPLYLLGALLVVGQGAGVLLFERFTEPSRRFFFLTVILAAWLAPLGLTRAVASPEAHHAWLRVTYLFVPLTVPALYWLARSLGAPPRRPPVALVWGAGLVLAALNGVTPWLVDGLQALLLDRTLERWGWLGALYLLLEVWLVLVTALRLLASRRGALSGEEQSEKVLLATAAVAGALSMLDYLMTPEPFRAGWITPVGMLVGTVLVTVSALRYRMFAPGQSFATDEVLSAMSDAVLVCDGVGLIRGANAACKRLLGRSERWLLGKPIDEVLGTTMNGDWHGCRPEAGVASREELQLRRRDEERIPVSVSIQPIRYGDRPVGAVVVARDIRERLEAEQALQEAQLRYSALYHHHPAVVHEFDVEGRLVSLNPAGRRLLGIGDDDPVSEHHWSDHAHPDDVSLLERRFGRVLLGSSEGYEVRLKGAGGYRTLRGVVVPVRDGRRIVGIFGIGLDVTDQVGAKRALEVQRHYFATLFESSPEGIVMVGEDDRVLRVNSEFTRMFGYTAEEGIGARLSDLIVPDHLQDEALRLSRAAQSDGLVKAETVRLRKDGSPVQVSLLARELSIPGEPPQLYGIYRDISDRKQTEQALREREEELRHAQKLEAVGKLAGGIAHDFNNLLTVINGHARFALENAGETWAMKEDLLEIERAGARAAALTQQLLAYSRRQVLHPQVLEPNAVIRDVEGMLRRLIGEHIRVETRLTDMDVRIRADRGQLEQVLVNLVVNARDAMLEGGTITLETDAATIEAGDPRVHRWEVEPGRFVRIRVADTGVGMDADTVTQAFEPFFTTKEQGKGTGLGLATVFGIVKQSGGHITLWSQPGEGTVCDVFIPAAEASAMEPAAAASEAVEAGPRGTILVVEDEAAVRRLAVKVLERAGCRVLAAENGVRALEVFDAHEGPLDLVLTDLVMPDMGGRDLAARLRKRRPDLPVVFMSGYDEDLVSDMAGDIDFLSKPFTPTTLARCVAGALAHARV